MARVLLVLVPLLALPLAACAGKPMRTGGPLPPTLACDAAPARWAIGRTADAGVLERVRADSHAQVGASAWIAHSNESKVPPPLTVCTVKALS